MKGFDVVIIGAGVTGLTTALTLQNSGAKVQILEKNPYSNEASWAGGGILCPLYAWRYPDDVLKLAALGMQQYPAFLSALDSDIDAEYYRCGMEIHDPTDASFPHLDAIQTRLANYGISQQRQNGHLALPKVANVRNPRLLKALTQAAQRAGVQIQYEHEVLTLHTEKNQINALSIRHNNAVTKLKADHCVVCSGAWSGKLIPGLADNVVFPVRGQMLRIRPKTPLEHIVMNQGVYAIPRLDGSVIIGSTVEYAGFDKQIDPQKQAQLQQIAAETSPELARAEVTHRWTGLRPGSRDEHPIIGPHPEINGLWINTGGFRNGLVMAPAASALLSALMQGQPTPLDPTPYLPQRLWA